jgi:hypothetical protein
LESVDLSIKSSRPVPAVEQLNLGGGSESHRARGRRRKEEKEGKTMREAEKTKTQTAIPVDNLTGMAGMWNAAHAEDAKAQDGLEAPLRPALPCKVLLSGEAWRQLSSPPQ